MRSRLPLLVLLAGPLAFLASLYLPWRTPVQAPGYLVGWTAPTGYAAGLLAVALAVAATVAILRPSRAMLLPFGGLGASLAYFAAAGAVELTAFAFPVGVYPGPSGWTGFGHVQWAWSSGVYLGCAAGGLAALAGLALRRKELFAQRTAADVAAAAFGLGLLASFLLPWERVDGITPIGLDSPAATLAAAALFVGAGWFRRAESRPRLAFLLAIALLTGAAATGVTVGGATAYGTWVGVGCAVALVGLEGARARAHLRLPAALPRPSAQSFGAFLLLVALWLPWQQFGVGPHAFSTNGWQSIYGASCGVLAMALLAVPLLPWVTHPAVEIALAIAGLVATFGVTVAAEANHFVHMGYGSYVGFAAAALLLLGVLAPLEPPAVDRRRAVVRGVPVAASLACIGAILVPAWQGVLPILWTGEARAVRSWFAVAALLLALHLLRLWVERIGPPPAPSGNLVVVPLLILPLPVLELFVDRALVAWGGVILAVLCLLLAALGWIERRGGLEGLGVPEVLRVDRLPETES